MRTFVVVLALILATNCWAAGSRIQFAEVDFTEGFQFEEVEAKSAEELTAPLELPDQNPLVFFAVLAAVIGLLVLYWTLVRERIDRFGIDDYGPHFWLAFVGIACAIVIGFSSPALGLLTAASAVVVSSVSIYRQSDGNAFLTFSTPVLLVAAVFNFFGTNKRHRRRAPRSRAIARPKKWKRVTRPKAWKPSKIPKPKVSKTPVAKHYTVSNFGKKRNSSSFISKNGNTTLTTTNGKNWRHTVTHRFGGNTTSTVTSAKGVKTYRTRSMRSRNHITRTRL